MMTETRQHHLVAETPITQEPFLCGHGEPATFLCPFSSVVASMESGANNQLPPESPLITLKTLGPSLELGVEFSAGASLFKILCTRSMFGDAASLWKPVNFMLLHRGDGSTHQCHTCHRSGPGCFGLPARHHLNDPLYRRSSEAPPLVLQLHAIG